MNKWNKTTGFLTFQLKCIKRPMLILIAVLVVLQFGLMYQRLSSLTYTATGYDYSNTAIDEDSAPAKEFDYAPSFQQMIYLCEYPTIWGWAAFIVFILLIRIPRQMQNGANSYYTLNRIPLTRKQQYYLQILLHGLVFFFLVCVELGVILLSYVMYSQMVPQNYQVYNELFQAYLNTDFLMLLCPVIHPPLLIMEIAFLLLLSVSSVQIRYHIREDYTLSAMCMMFLTLLAYSNLFFIYEDGGAPIPIHVLLCLIISGVLPVLMRKNDYCIKPRRKRKKERML